MTTPALTRQFRCISLTEGSEGKINVNFTEVVDSADTQPFTFSGVGNLSLSMVVSEAEGYFPGQKYDVALTLRSE